MVQVQESADARIDLNKLRAARGARTLAEVAAMAGISRQQLWNYENGRHKPSADVILRICIALRIPIESLAA
jgi:transcriptional regulator with XRE-family HTH domain